MKKSFIKTFILFAFVLFGCLCLSSCKEKTYKIEYELNGGTLPSNAPTTYVKGEETKLVNPTKAGATFEGWHQKADLSDAKITVISKKTKGDLKLYAKWETSGSTQDDIKYELNGGSFPDGTDVPRKLTGSVIVLPTPVKASSTFEGWYRNADFTGDVVAFLSADEQAPVTLYAKFSVGYQPAWELNRNGYNCGAQEVKIKVLPVNEFDPTNADYTGDHKAIKQIHMSMINAAYNVKVKYEAWDNDAQWGPQRVQFIRENFMDGSFQKKGVYIVNITASWIPTLVKANCLAPLYDLSTQTGLFADYDYEQSPVFNQAMSSNKLVYGYDTGIARPDYFLYYNATLAKQAGMTDPAELWFQGKWTWSTFEQWVKQAQTNLPSDCYAIDAGFAEFFIGAAPAQGYKLVDNETKAVQFANGNQAGIFDKMKELYRGNYWNPSHGTNDVTTQFNDGKTIFASGSLWFLKNNDRFKASSNDYTIGCVPYPANDKETMTPYTEPYSYVDTSGNVVTVDTPIQRADGTDLTDDAGNKIYGLDLTAATKFLIPFTDTANYSILNFGKQAGIPQTVIFNILHDLVGGLGKDPDDKIEVTADEGYRTYLNSKLDAAIYSEVIMSVQDPNLSYFELFEVLSMTAGDGSHFGEYGFWPIAASMIKSNDPARTKLREILPVYQEALDQLGI